MTNDDSIMLALRGDATLSGMIKTIGHGQVPPGTKTPYIIVQDLGGDEPEYAFGNVEMMSDALYTIEVITTDADEENDSAQGVANKIIKRIYDVLQNASLPMVGRRCMNMRRLGRTGSSWEESDGDGEMYYIDGHRWGLATQPM